MLCKNPKQSEVAKAHRATRKRQTPCRFSFHMASTILMCNFRCGDGSWVADRVWKPNHDTKTEFSSMNRIENESLWCFCVPFLSRFFFFLAIKIFRECGMEHHLSLHSRVEWSGEKKIKNSLFVRGWLGMYIGVDAIGNLASHTKSKNNQLNTGRFFKVVAIFARLDRMIIQISSALVQPSLSFSSWNCC